MTRVDVDRAPYVGPRPYMAGDRALFFGRDAEIAELVSLVIAHRNVLLYAVSGAGKSSLLRAGLITALAEQGFEVLGPLRFQSGFAPPAEAGNVYSYAALRALTDLVDANGQQLDPSLELGDFLAGLPRGADTYGFPSPRVVIFDQFEEIFTTHQERWQHREDFLRQVAEALDRDPELRTVFSMREEYIAQLDRYAALLPDSLRARFHLERLRAPSALLAVTGPLALWGVDFEPGVAETLVHDLQETRIDTGAGTALRVGGEFVEPVQLQVVCRTLWSRLDPAVRHVTADDLAALGNVDDSLAQYYNDAIAGAAARTQVSEHRLRDELERLLITSAGTRATVFAGEKETATLPAAALDELADRHLIRAEWRAGGRWLELAHDRLIEPIRHSNQAVRERHRRHRRRRTAIGAALLSIALIVGVAAVSSVWFSLSPQEVPVPEVTGAKSAFEAERKLTAAGLTLNSTLKTRTTEEAPPGTVIGQTPAAGDKVRTGSEVALEVAAGSDKAKVPSLSGVDLARADSLLRRAGLTLGQASPAAPDPAAVVVSQIPAPGEIVKTGEPVNIFLGTPGKDRSAGGGGGADSGSGRGGGGGGGVTVPKGPKDPSPEAYAQEIADLGLVPVVKKISDASKEGTVLGTEPPPGTIAAAGDKVTLLVSAGSG